MSLSTEKVLSILFLAIATIILLAVFVTNGLAGSSNASDYGFRNRTGEISDQFSTQVQTFNVILV
jgi:hypothetical protein